MLSIVLNSGKDPSYTKHFAFWFQGFEAYVGVLLLKTALAGFFFEWQVDKIIKCTILYFYMIIFACFYIAS